MEQNLESELPLSPFSRDSFTNSRFLSLLLFFADEEEEER